MAKPRIAAPPHRNHEVLCIGGPWHNKPAWFPVQDPGDPLSLPIVVGEWRGRYNLSNGRWVPAAET